MLFISILQFLTTITVNKNAYYDGDISDGIIFFPIVGAILGAIEFGICYLLKKIGLDTSIIAIVVVLCGVLLTGGLHVDGLGDTFDGIFSYRDVPRVLGIMKDSRLGTNGMLSILFSVLIKVKILEMLILKKEYLFILFMPVFARLLAVFLTYKTKSARKNGMGEMFIGKGQLKSLIFDSFLVIFISSFLMGIVPTIYVVVSQAFFLFIFKKFMYKRIGGLTGDTLGCAIELSEILVLAVGVL